MEPEIFYQYSKAVPDVTQTLFPGLKRTSLDGTWQAEGGLRRHLRRGRPLVVEEARGGACWFYCPKA